MAPTQYWKTNGLFQPRLFEVLRDNQLHAYRYPRSALLFLHDRSLRTKFCGCLRHQHQHFANELSSYNIIEERKLLHTCVFNAHNSHLLTHDSPHSIHEIEYQVD
jgi:hypothetical protein